MKLSTFIINKFSDFINKTLEQANASILDLKDQLTKHELRVESQEELIKQLKSKITNKESEFLIEKQNSSKQYRNNHSFRPRIRRT